MRLTDVLPRLFLVNVHRLKGSHSRKKDGKKVCNNNPIEHYQQTKWRASKFSFTEHQPTTNAHFGVFWKVLLYENAERIKIELCITQTESVPLVWWTLNTEQQQHIWLHLSSQISACITLCGVPTSDTSAHAHPIRQLRFLTFMRNPSKSFCVHRLDQRNKNRLIRSIC